MKQVHPKLIVITRRDLAPGYQAVQAAHASIEFQYEHSEIAKEWNNHSKYLVFLSVENEQELYKYLERIQFYDIKHSTFFEPDLGNQLTAIAIEPSEASQKLTSRLPLVLKELNFNKNLTTENELSLKNKIIFTP